MFDYMKLLEKASEVFTKVTEIYNGVTSGDYKEAVGQLSELLKLISESMNAPTTAGMFPEIDLVKEAECLRVMSEARAKLTKVQASGTTITPAEILQILQMVDTVIQLFKLWRKRQ